MSYLQRLVDRASGLDRPTGSRAIVYPAPKPGLGTAPTPGLGAAWQPTPPPSPPASHTAGEPEVAIEDVGTPAALVAPDAPAEPLESHDPEREHAPVDSPDPATEPGIEAPGPAETHDPRGGSELSESQPPHASPDARDPAEVTLIGETPADSARRGISNPADRAAAERAAVSEVEPVHETETFETERPDGHGSASAPIEVVPGRPATDAVEGSDAAGLRTRLRTSTTPPVETSDQPIEVVIDSIEIVGVEEADQPQPGEPRTIGFADYQSLRAYEWEA